MAQELSAVLRKQFDDCAEILESKRRRISDLAKLLSTKNSTFVDGVQIYLKAFDEIEALVSKGVNTACAELHEDLLKIDDELIAEYNRLAKDHEEAYDQVAADRRRFEVDECIPKLLDDLAEQRSKEWALVNSLVADRHGQEKTLREEIFQLREELEQQPAQRIKDRFQLDFEVDIFDRQIGDAKKDIRSLKRQTIKMHTVRNELRDELARTEAAAVAAKKKQAIEFRRLVKNLEFFKKKLTDIEKINSDKFSRIYDSNVREIGFMSAQLKDSMRHVYQEIFNLDWVDPGEEADDPAETGTLAGKSTLSGNGVQYSQQKIKQVLQLVEKEMSFLVPDKACGLKGMESILEYLGVSTKSDLNLLVSMFYQGQDEDDEELYVESTDCLEIIQEFLAEKEAKDVSEIASGKRKQKEGNEKAKAQLREKVKRETEKVWKRFAHPVPEHEVKQLEQILEILQEQLRLRTQLRHAS